MDPKRSEPFGERAKDDVEAGARDVGDAIGGAARRVGDAAGDVADAARTSVHAAGEAFRETLEPGETVVVGPAGRTGETTVVESTGVVAGTAAAAAVGEGGRDWLSMSTDNTAAGRTGDITNTGPIDLVENGMRVFDANGDELGKVDSIKMGDPGAVTTRGEEPYDGGDLLDEIGRAVFGGEELPEQIRHNLLRVGYIRVDGKGWFDTDYFAAADQIATVEGDAVRLSVAKEALPTV